MTDLNYNNKVLFDSFFHNIKLHYNEVTTNKGVFRESTRLNDSRKSNYFRARSLNGKVTYNVNRCNGIAYKTNLPYDD